ncbi:MAG: hypothetical protein V3V25_09215 [Paracoccaceae bacterium]
MNNDLILVFGVIIAVFAVPSVISAFSAGRAPRTATILFMVGGSMIAWAVYKQPNSYTAGNFPDVFVSVFRSLMR